MKSITEGIAMPAPHKPLALRTHLHMLIPRLDPSSPSPQGPYTIPAQSLPSQGYPFPSATALGSSANSSTDRQSFAPRRLGIATNKQVSFRAACESPLSPLVENMEKTMYSKSYPQSSGDDDALAELMEIVGTRRSAASSPAASSRKAVDYPANFNPNRRRSSTVPDLFPTSGNGLQDLLDKEDASDRTDSDNDTNEDDHSTMRRSSNILEPPRLATTPFRPTAIRTDMLSSNNDAASGVYGASLRVTQPSPVSRSKNPLPLNSPFLGRRRAGAASPSHSPTYMAGRGTAALNSSNNGVELGLLSPSPEPKLYYHSTHALHQANAQHPVFYRSVNPIPARLADLVGAYYGATDFHARPRSKSVTDLDSRIRMAFAC
ncbi:hypothetical protein DFS34DRAFT_682163 [Phlyctochytrium arcticum]|nr:hypothetical protein DFS34DRAFT_682163 [Phlyctochytrium arcticum]